MWHERWKENDASKNRLLNPFLVYYPWKWEQFFLDFQDNFWYFQFAIHHYKLSAHWIRIKVANEQRMRVHLLSKTQLDGQFFSMFSFQFMINCTSLNIKYSCYVWYHIFFKHFFGVIFVIFDFLEFVNDFLFLEKNWLSLTFHATTLAVQLLQRSWCLILTRIKFQIQWCDTW